MEVITIIFLLITIPGLIFMIYGFLQERKRIINKLNNKNKISDYEKSNQSLLKDIKEGNWY